MIVYNVVKLEEVLDKLKDMFASHASETELYQDRIGFNPNYDMYQILSNTDSLFFIVAQDEEEIVGYMSLLIEEHPHHKDIQSCTNNLLYVKKEYRGQYITTNMFNIAEEFLKDCGVSLFMFATKASNPLKSFADSMGFDECEVVYSKYIGGENK